MLRTGARSASWTVVPSIRTSTSRTPLLSTRGQRTLPGRPSGFRRTFSRNRPALRWVPSDLLHGRGERDLAVGSRPPAWPKDRGCATRL